MEYVVVKSNDLADLQHRVIALVVESGWELQGGIALAVVPDSASRNGMMSTNLYAQALTRRLPQEAPSTDRSPTGV